MHIEIEHPAVDSRFNLWPENRMHIVPDLGGDSEDYDVLARAVEAVGNTEGLSIQIGLRLGYGAKLIMDTMRDTGQDRLHIAVDPYGDIEYDATDSDRSRRDYTNHMMHDGLANLHLYALLNRLNFLFFPLEDTEFFRRFADGVPVYDTVKHVETDYALVVLDGPHATAPVLAEYLWFNDRTRPGAVMVFDDVRTYDHKAVDTIVSKEWTSLEQGECKWSYVKEDA